jgi:hypothetical protein
MNTRAFMCLAAVVLLAFAHSALAREHSGTLLAPTGTDGRPLADPLASTRSMPDWNTVRDDLAVTTDGRLVGCRARRGPFVLADACRGCASVHLQPPMPAPAGRASKA